MGAKTLRQIAEQDFKKLKFLEQAMSKIVGQSLDKFAEQNLKKLKLLEQAMSKIVGQSLI